MKRGLIPILVLATSLLLTLVASLAVGITSNSRDEAHFANAVQSTSDRVFSRLQAHIALLQSGTALFAASEDVTFEEFRRFVEKIPIEEAYSGVQGIGFTMRVPEASEDSVKATLRDAGIEGFDLWPDIADDEPRHSIVYLFPLDRRNRAALGFNMYSEPVRREAMASARDSGDPAMSGIVTLVQEIEGPQQAGFLIFVPVYKSGETPISVAERREELAGFVYAPFRADDLFAGIFGTEQLPGVALRVYDGLSIREDRLLHDSSVHGVIPSTSPDFSMVTTIYAAGRPWTIEFLSTPAFEANMQPLLGLAILLLGLVATLALFGMSRKQVEARAEAEDISGQLRESAAELERQMEDVRSLNEELAEKNRELLRLSVTAESARDEAEKANRAKAEFLAAMSHELRTPLNAITGYAELIEMGIHGPVSEKQIESLGKIKRSQRHLLTLINDILQYAKLEAGRVQFRREKASVTALLADLRSMTEPQMQAKGLESEFSPCQPGVAVWGDTEKIQQILLNLVTNAIKFTASGGRIHIRCSNENDVVRIHVEDTGEGVESDRLESIFDPFVQSTRAGGDDSRQGVGLGLAISRDLAENMGGKLDVQSQVGVGSTFTLTLARVTESG